MARVVQLGVVSGKDKLSLYFFSKGDGGLVLDVLTHPASSKQEYWPQKRILKNEGRTLVYSLEELTGPSPSRTKVEVFVE